MIGGNVSALIQVKDSGTKNTIGERIHQWVDVTSLKGFLDYQGGQNGFQTYDIKMQETTHIFICDFNSLKSLSKGWVWNPFSLVNGVIRTVTQEETQEEETEGTQETEPVETNDPAETTGTTEETEETESEPEVVETVDLTSENARMFVNGNLYQILLIDDPMGLHKHLEIYLKYVGGGLGV